MISLSRRSLLQTGLAAASTVPFAGRNTFAQNPASSPPLAAQDFNC